MGDQPRKRNGRFSQKGHTAPTPLELEHLAREHPDLLAVLKSAAAPGGFRDWQRVAAAIERDPWGEVAADVRAYLSYEQPYGVGPLMMSVIAAARARSQEEEKASVAARIRELIASSGLTRRAFADAVGTSATRLSTYCTGSVTPSAALLLRMERASASRTARRSPAGRRKEMAPATVDESTH